MNAPLPASITSTPSLVSMFNASVKFRTDISNADYHADRSCVSVSGLKQILRSPDHYRYYLDAAKRKETPAMFFGTALHMRILEPKAFATDYLIAPCNDRRTVEFKSFTDSNPGKIILTPSQAGLLEEMAKRIYGHQSAFALLTGGIKEATLIWQDEETGVWIKIRPDCLSLDFDTGICLDLKSTDDASPAAFARTCVDYGYDLQGAAYLEGLRAVFKRDFDFALLPAEKEPPHAVALYGAPESMLERGRRLFRRALRLVQECNRSNTWPSYQPEGDYEVLDWPSWAK